MYLYYNDSLIDENTAAVKPLCQGFQFGLGVFETILVQKGVPCFMEEHLDRLQQGCAKLGLQLPFSRLQLKNQAQTLVAKNKTINGRLKITCFRDLDGTSVLMTLADYAFKEDISEEGFKLLISELKRNPYSPVAYIKSLNYAESILAREEANRQGYDEALFLNVHNKLCEGSVSNIFWVKDGAIFTPEISCGILAGITRGQVIQICHKLKLKLVEGSFELTDLLQAEEVFVTNSLMGIMPVSRVAANTYDISSYKVVRMLNQEHRKLINKELL